MLLAKVILFMSLCCVVRAAKSKGYIVMDMKEIPSCFNMPRNHVCPASSFNHKVVGAGKSPQALARLNLHAVKVEVGGAGILGASQACKDDLREYSCSNNLMKCKVNPMAFFGVELAYDFKKTELACAKVKKSCSAEVQSATIHNCSVIQTNPMEFSFCRKLPTVAGDVCPCTDFMYPVALAKFYPIQAKAFSALFHKFTTQYKALKNKACEAEFKGVYCQILRGGICSGTKRLYAISRQDCGATMKKCVTTQVFKDHLLQVCKLLPDRATSKSPLPPVTTCSTNSNNAASVNSASGK